MIDLKNLRTQSENLATMRARYFQISVDGAIELLDMLAAAQKDAARYQWLKNNHLRIWRSNLESNLGAESMDLDFEAEGCDLDEAIDAAMQS